MAARPIATAISIPRMAPPRRPTGAGLFDMGESIGTRKVGVTSVDVVIVTLVVIFVLSPVVAESFAGSCVSITVGTMTTPVDKVGVPVLSEEPSGSGPSTDDAPRTTPGDCVDATGTPTEGQVARAHGGRF